MVGQQYCTQHALLLEGLRVSCAMHVRVCLMVFILVHCREVEGGTDLGRGGELACATYNLTV